MSPLRLFSVILLICLWHSDLVLACSACGFSDDSRGAFLSTAVMMTFVPLIVLGVGVWWLIKRIRSLESEDEKARLANHSSSEHLPDC